MAEDWRERRRRREQEDQEADAALKLAKNSPKQAARAVQASENYVEKLEELFSRAEPLIEQVSMLYQQYVIGIESRPPIERRTMLDQLIQTLQTMNKPSTQWRYRFTSLNQSYLTHRERWDRLARDLESGKIKRIVAPRRKSGI